MDSSDQTGVPLYTAIKTEPLGSSILVRTEDVPEYEALRDSVEQEFRPETTMEKLLTQGIVSHQWRIRDMAKLEKGFMAIGQARLGSRFTSEEDLRTCTEQIDPSSKTTYEKQFKYIAKQVRFLQTRLKHDTKELSELLKNNPRSKYRGLFLVPKRKKPTT